ncbi:MAG: Esterase [Sphingobacteriales bacterium]|nr:Esterase [Sphingobacteriales bacterium]
MANKDVVTVIINYTLSPQSEYKQMATECASAVKWVKENISQYGGNPDKIFLMGHSAGGHLAALVDVDPSYFAEVGILNPIKGVILNDTFGLDMFEYLSSAEKGEQTNSFLHTFSNDIATWKKGSPLTYFNNVKHPYLIFSGGETYPSIKVQSKRLSQLMVAKKLSSEYYIIKNKKHVAMISQMVFSWNNLYNYITTFIKIH